MCGLEFNSINRGGIWEKPNNTHRFCVSHSGICTFSKSLHALRGSGCLLQELSVVAVDLSVRSGAVPSAAMTLGMFHEGAMHKSDEDTSPVVELLMPSVHTELAHKRHALRVVVNVGSGGVHVAVLVQRHVEVHLDSSVVQQLDVFAMDVQHALQFPRGATVRPSSAGNLWPVVLVGMTVEM